ncbi:pyridoxal phosphate-dependent aminotransferase [Alphaproteobacteria bacterium]|nr:pyridoxal phosphate-dependent aminotransferase [Alphaproteobacteria bacterium]
MLNRTLLSLGTETAFTVLARAGELANQGKSIINLGIGQPDFSTPPHIVDAGITALRDGAHGYTPSMGLPILREAVQEDLSARYGYCPPISQIQITPGGKPVIFMAAMIYGGVDSEIILPNPSFPIYQSAVAYSQATPVFYSLKEQNGFAFNADEILSKITSKTNMIMINSPHNPTGGITPPSEIKKLVEGLTLHPNITLFSDEIYDRLVFDNKPHSLLSYPEIRDRLILLNGWSKTYAMTGWRIGYGIWPKQAIEFADKIGVNYHSCVNAPTQFAALAATTGDQSCVEEMRLAFSRRAAIITHKLNEIKGISCQKPKGAFYAFPNISAFGISSDKIQTELLEEFGVAGISGTAFGSFGEGYLRLSSANSDALISEACDRLKQLANGYL